MNRRKFMMGALAITLTPAVAAAAKRGEEVLPRWTPVAEYEGNYVFVLHPEVVADLRAAGMLVHLDFRVVETVGHLK